ncbi:hypothetical protein LCGC14_1925680, partial [marine sediment metagenome]
MRLYHKFYRQQNPGRRMALLRGEKKEVHDVLMRTLENPGGRGRRRKNPDGQIKKRGLGRSIDAFNLLGKLNEQIEEEGRTDLIPLRDTVAARIEGY